MDILNFLKLQEFKNKFSLETLVVIWFTFICSYTFFHIGIFFLSKMGIGIKSIVGVPGELLFYGLIFVTFLIIGFKLFKILHVKNKFLYLITKHNLQLIEGEFNYQSILQHFIFQGHVDTSYEKQNCLFLNHSADGLLTKKIFRNPIIIFDAKMKLEGFGIIISARDLENYVMFRVNFEPQKQIMYLTPHVRKYGIWEIQDITNRGEVDGLKDIKYGEKLNFKIDVIKRFVTIEIQKEGKLIKAFSYIIPSHFPLVHRPKDKNNESNNKESNNKESSPTIAYSKLDIDSYMPSSDLNIDSYGKVGFRAYGRNEQAIIYNLKIASKPFSWFCSLFNKLICGVVIVLTIAVFYLLIIFLNNYFLGILSKKLLYFLYCTDLF